MSTRTTDQKDASSFDNNKLNNISGVDILPPISAKHRTFLAIISTAFGFLSAELLIFVPNYYTRTIADNKPIWLVAAFIFVLTLVSVWASFSLPHIYYAPRIKRYSPIIFLMREWTVGAIILIVVSLVTLGAGVWLVDANLEATAELVRSIGLYALTICVIFHGLVLFARYVHYLYERSLDQGYKVVSITGGAAALILILSLFLFQQDFNRMSSANGLADSGLLVLHLSVRGIFLLATCIFCVAWLLSVLADH